MHALLEVLFGQVLGALPTTYDHAYIHAKGSLACCDSEVRGCCSCKLRFSKPDHKHMIFNRLAGETSWILYWWRSDQYKNQFTWTDLQDCSCQHHTYIEFCSFVAFAIQFSLRKNFEVNF